MADPNPTGNRKIAILGGGPAGLAAAWELTRYPGWRDHYEVTVYQLGWRLGGKCATGRGPADRIQEHGIHIFQGWYDNTFFMLREVFAERDAKGLAPDSPFPGWQDAFQRDNATILTQFLPDQTKWGHWTVVFPENNRLPGDGPPLPVWEVMIEGVGLALELILGSPYRAGEGPLARWILSEFFPTPDGPGCGVPRPLSSLLRSTIESVAETMGALFGGVTQSVEARAITEIRALLESIDAPTDAGGRRHDGLDRLIQLLRGVAGCLRKLADEAAGVFDAVARDLILVELALANLIGMVEDVWDPSARKFDFERINQLDYRAWLATHGASREVCYSPMVRFIYAGTFSNQNDADDRGGLFAAGTALHSLIRVIGYKGSLVWAMRAGTADTVITPIYQVLASRGVEFEFFNQVMELVPAPRDGDADAAADVDDTDRPIDRVVIGRQARLIAPPYRPLVPLEVAGSSRDRGHTLHVWPARPLYDQIVPEQAAALRAGNIDLESPWADWTPEQTELRAGEDYDLLVLAIPVAALRDICPKLIAENPRWQRMVDEIKTTQTQSFQLWLRPTLRELGMVMSDWGLPPRADAPNVVVYANPTTSWSDNTLVLPYESWPAHNRPGSIAYYTGPMRDAPVIPPYGDHRFPTLQHERVRATAATWLNAYSAYLWPKGAAPECPQGLDFTLLCTPGGHSLGQEGSLAYQYFRANISPSERYTLAEPYTEQPRLRTDDSGYANLYLAGDWIDFGLNAGFFEGAVTAGRQAAQAVRTRLGLGGHDDILVPEDVQR